MSEEQKKPGRPRVRAMVLEVGLTEEGAKAYVWLKKRWGLTSNSACVNEMATQHAMALGWKGPKKSGGR